MPPQLATGAPDKEVRHVVVVVLIRVTHIGAVHDQRVIQQRAVAIRDRPELLREVRHGGDVIPVDVRVAPHFCRVVLVVRLAMEAPAGAAVREQRTPRKGVRAACEIPRAEHRGHAGDVRLERQREHVEMQLDVLVELFRDADRESHLRHVE